MQVQLRKYKGVLGNMQVWWLRTRRDLLTRPFSTSSMARLTNRHCTWEL